MLISEDDWHDYAAEQAYELRREHAIELYDPLMQVTGADTFWTDKGKVWYYDFDSDIDKVLTAPDIVKVSHIANFTAGYVRELIEDFIVEWS